MKIEIDTKHDSRDEIINAIRILQSVVNERGSKEIFSNKSDMSNTQSNSAQSLIDEGINLFEEKENHVDNEKPDFVNIFQDFANKESQKNNESHQSIFDGKKDDERKEESVISDFFANEPPQEQSSSPEQPSEEESKESKEEFFKEYEEEDKFKIKFY